VKPVAIIILGLLAASLEIQSHAVEKKYTGRAVIADLGNVAFPAGEWSLEFQRIQASTNALHLPDYFVFKKVSDPLERLTFLRYPPTTTPRQLAHMLDTVGETMGDGVPWQERKEYSIGGEIHPMRLEPHSPTSTERTITFSFIHVRPSPAPAWLCHSFLFLHGGSAFVLAHASTSVINPETVSDVHFRSEFYVSRKPAREDK
jgi:hypothetical protein